MIVNMWAQNHDWPHNNWYAARERAPDGKWIFLCWDAEFGIGLIPTGYNSDSLDHVVGRSGYIRDIFVRLLANEDYRRFFMAALERFSATVLAPQNVLRHIAELRSVTQLDIPEEMTQFSQNPTNWANNIAARWRRSPAIVRAFFLSIIRNSSRFDFPVDSTPILTSVNPPVVVNSGRATVEFIGSRFTLTTRVFVAGVEIQDLVFRNSTRVTLDLPFDEGIEGEVEIRLVNPATEEESEWGGLLEVLPPVPEVVRDRTGRGAVLKVATLS